MNAPQSAVENQKSEIRNPLLRVVALTMAARLVHDTQVRVVYPFLPEIAAGLRAPIDSVSAALSLRSGVGILSPVAGLLSDRIGHRRAMSVALVTLAFGMATVGSSNSLELATVGFILSGFATAVYVPAMLAYVSERTPYAGRGRVLGAIEMMWAIAGMAAVPLLGALIAPLGWRAPFLALAAGAVVAAALTLTLSETPSSHVRGSPIHPWLILRNPSAVAFLIVWLLVFLAFENIQVGYASWFESQFGLSARERGFTQTLFGVFEITASAGSSLFLDRMGKKRGVTGGLFVGLLGYALLASLGPQALWLGLLSMSIAFLGFEFSVVSGLSIGSEQVPQARGTMLALGVMAGGLGRMIGAVTGGSFLAGAGFTTAALVSAGLAVASIVVFVAYVRERPHSA